MVVQIPLRRKYRRAMKGRYKGGEHPAPKKGKRRKIGQRVHEERHGAVQPKTLVVDGKTGKSRMQNQ